MPLRFVGRVTYERGKPLYEILARLKNFGIGRMVYRNREMTRYKGPSYYIISGVQLSEKLQPLNSLHHRVNVHKYFGGEYVGELKIRHCYKPDWRLVPRNGEEELRNSQPATPQQIPIIPDAIKFPPLLERMILEEKRKAGEDVSETPMLPITIRREPGNRAIQESEARSLGLI